VLQYGRGTPLVFLDAADETGKEEEDKMDFQGYCVKCREKRDIKGGEKVKTSKGRPMAKGVCPVCGTTVTRFLSTKK
jgi:hypothetical protein